MRRLSQQILRMPSSKPSYLTVTLMSLCYAWKAMTLMTSSNGWCTSNVLSWRLNVFIRSAAKSIVSPIRELTSLSLDTLMLRASAILVLIARSISLRCSMLIWLVQVYSILSSIILLNMLITTLWQWIELNGFSISNCTVALTIDRIIFSLLSRSQRIFADWSMNCSTYRIYFPSTTLCLITFT
jgi:hypothetical protein